MIAAVLGYLGGLDQRVWWFFRAASTLHFIGLSLLVGALLVMDLRALGVIRNVSYAQVAGLTRVAVLGLLINVVSGVVMLSSKPIDYWQAWPFRYKMIALVVALVNALWFTSVGQQKLLSLPPGARALGRSIFEFASSG
jgi:hypothetical protein